MLLADPIRFRKLATGWSFIGAGILWVAGMAATRWGGTGTAAYLDSLAAAPKQAQVAALLLHFGFLLLVPAVIGTLAVLKSRGVVLGHVAAIFIVLGGTTLPGLLVTDFYDLSIAENLPRDTGVAVSEGVADYPGVMVLFLPAVVGTALGVILGTLGLWRARIVPLGAPALCAAGLAMGLFGPETLAGSVASGLVLALGLGLCGVAVLRLPLPEWQAGGPAPVDKGPAGSSAVTP